MHKKIIYFILYSSLLLLLIGCGIKSSPQYFDRLTEINKNDYFANIEISKLQQLGVAIENNSKFTVLRIPEKKLFYANSTNLTSDGRMILNKIIKLISFYDIETVTVTNYDFVSNYQQIDQTNTNIMAKNRALKIERYFWTQSVDASIINTRNKLLQASENNKSLSGFATISFEKHYKYN